MKLEDWHTHSALCHHAVGTIDDYVKSAIEKNLATIGLSDHFPYEFLNDIERIPFKEYAITLDEIDGYFQSAEAVRERYKDKIDVRISFEVDFFENQEHLLNEQLDKIKSKLDYILGSIHILNFHDGRGAWGFDDSRFREDYLHYGPDKVFLKYFETMRKMLESKSFDVDIIGHFDLPKKFGDTPSNEEKLFDSIVKTLELIKRRDLVMEINTGGLRKEVGEQYPSQEIISKMYELDIPIVLGSDAHDPKEVAWEFEKIIALLKDIGYDQLAHFENRERSFINIK